MSSAAGRNSSTLGQFDVVPYRPDGAISGAGALQLVGFLGLAGIVLGVLVSFIARWIWLILIFPIIIGLAVGALGSKLIKSLKVRNPAACGVAGFLAGSLAMFAMHYTEYRMVRANLEQNLGENAEPLRQIAMHLDELKAQQDLHPDVMQVVQQLNQEPVFVRLLLVDSVWGYIDHMAHEGVELKKAGRGGNGINLGYYGSYIYWVLEALIVAGVAYAIMSSAAAEPYCSDCHQWKETVDWGPVDQAAEAAQSLSEGTIRPFVPSAGGVVTPAMVKVYTCPNCETAGTIDVKVESLHVNSKGETTRKKLAFVTFPGTARPLLHDACHLKVELPSETPADSAETSPAAAESTEPDFEEA